MFLGVMWSREREGGAERVEHDRRRGRGRHGELELGRELTS